MSCFVTTAPSGAGIAAAEVPAGQADPDPHKPPTATALLATVPRELVHRVNPAGVFLTGWDRGAAPDSYTVRAYWPHDHALYAPVAGRADPLALAEVVRQAGMLLAHAEYAVPLGHHFVMRELTLDAPEPVAAGPRAASVEAVELHVRCHDIARRGGTIAGMRYEAAVVLGGRRIAIGAACFSCVSPAVHQRLRGRHPGPPRPVAGPPVDPASVGRADGREVVLAEPARVDRVSGATWESCWELRVDPGHPVFFDHPVDHVPGMLLIEAARQAARAAADAPLAVVAAFDASFARYAELDEPCLVRARREGGDGRGGLRVSVQATQRAEVVFEAGLSLHPYPYPHPHPHPQPHPQRAGTVPAARPASPPEPAACAPS